MSAYEVPTDLTLDGPRPLRGTLRVPGDKGISHRALLFAAMADGRSRVTGLAGGDDVRRTRRAIEALGVAVTVDKEGCTIDGRGIDALTEPVDVLDCGNSGTSIRLLTGLLSGRPFLTVLTGDKSLVTRPMRRVVEPLRAMGAHIDGRADGALAPLVVRGGNLSGTDHTLAVASAQVKTAIVLAGLQADGVTTVTEPAPSRDHTERMLAALGAPVARLDERCVQVTRGAPGPLELHVPGDPSSAAFWAVAAAITPGSDLTIEGLDLNPTRIAFVDVLARMGASIGIEHSHDELGEPVGALHVRHGALQGTTIQGAEIPWLIDEIPVLAVAAAFAEGMTHIRDAAELRVKESDRVATVAGMLGAMGIGVETADDGLSVRGGRPVPARFESHGDHRIAMSAAVAANALEGESTVVNWRSTATSYPEFGADLARLTGRSSEERGA
jgi:3-phosphoshikimate 1-carboxyvinyltransferase